MSDMQQFFPQIGPRSQGEPRAPVSAGLRSGLVGIGAVSCVLWCVPLGVALYSLLLLDVALPSHNGATIAGTMAVAVALAVAFFVLGGLRRRLVVQTATAFLHRVRGQAARGDEASRDRIDDLDRVAALASGPVPAAIIDLLSFPLLCAVVALMGWPLGATLAAGGTVVVLCLAIGVRRIGSALAVSDRDRAARDQWRQAREGAGQTLDLLGMDARIDRLCTDAVARVLDADRIIAARQAWTVTSIAIAFGAVSIGVATLGAWMTATGRGGIGSIAATLLLCSFAFLPGLRVAGNLAIILRAREAFRRLHALAATGAAAQRPIALPRPKKALVAERIVLRQPGSDAPLLRDVSLALGVGDVVAVAGPAGVGKSLLLRALAGAVPLASGKVRLDGSAADQWDPAERLRHFGYLPQLPNLLPGTIAENIGRFDPVANPQAVIEAARAAGIHELIMRLPRGYETRLVLGAAELSPCIQQRIALARACYGAPFVLLLDAPAAWQDRHGMSALIRCIADHSARGGIAVVVGTEPAIVEIANLVLLLRPGGMVDFGPKDDVRDRMNARRSHAATPVKPTTLGRAARATASPSE